MLIKAIPITCVLTTTLLMSSATQALNTHDLPDDVWFKNNQQTFNSVYYSAVNDGNIWVKPNSLLSGEEGQWQQLELPRSLAGQVKEIASDDEHIIAINHHNEIYTMWSALGEVEKFRWQKAWGFPFWFGLGHTMNESLLKWDFSVVSPELDEYYTDPAGNLSPVGFAKVSHIIGLKPDGRNVAYNDPWLATDWSYEICGPERGRFSIKAQSAAGSTTFVMGEYGDMFTRIYDFDLAGHNDLFKYSYEDQSGRPPEQLPLSGTHMYTHAVQLPTFPWVEQPKINGRITDRMSIYKVGKGVFNRVLRVEGWNEAGISGFYQKELIEADWTFHSTGHAIVGNEINNLSNDMSQINLLDSEGKSYERAAKKGWWARITKTDWQANIDDFDPYCSPAPLTITSRDGNKLNIQLHGRETIRAIPRARGINNQLLRLHGAMEIDQATWDNRHNLDATLQKFIKKHFNKKRIRTVTLWVTEDRLKVTHTNGLDLINWSFNAK